MASFDRESLSRLTGLARGVGPDNGGAGYSSPAGGRGPSAGAEETDPPESARARRAASILEEERGLRGTDLPDGPNKEWQNPAAAMERLRRQAGDLADTLVEVLGQKIGRGTGIAGVAAGEQPSPGGWPGALVLRPVLVEPGQCGEVVLTLENEDPGETARCAFQASDLVGNSGSRIPARQVRVFPSPARIPPGGSVDVQVEIRVPNGTPAGNYAGLLVSDDAAQPPAVLQVHVTG